MADVANNVGSRVAIKFRNKLSKGLEEGIIKNVDINAFIRDSLIEACEKITAYARHHHPSFKTRSGRLERAIQYRLVNGAESGTIYINEIAAIHREHGKDYYYAPYVQNGTRPHDIVGKYTPHKKLKFYWEKMDKYIVVHRVHHPGTSPIDIEKPIINAKKSVSISKIFSKNLERLLNG